MVSSIVKVLTCKCNPEHIYNSSSAFSAHKKSKRHKAWECGQQSEKVEAKRRDDDIFRLELKLKDREEQIEKTKLNEQLSPSEDVDTLNLCELLKKENIRLKTENNAFRILLKKDV